MQISSRITVLAAALLVSVPAAAQCLGGSNPCHAVPSGTVADGEGAVPGPWLSGNTYVIQGAATVPSGKTLTILPGAVVKFDGDTTRLSSLGTLDARGTAAQPIVFTSYRDDTVGGDTNGDGAATTPQVSDWQRLDFNSGSATNVLEHCEVRYGGRYNSAAVFTYGAAGVTLRDVTIRSCQKAALDLNGQVPALIEGCAFEDGDAAVIGVVPAAIPKFLNNTASGNAQGDVLQCYIFAAIEVKSSASWSKQNTLNENGVVLFTKDLDVNNGVVWTLGPGMNLKFSDGVEVDVGGGSLVAQGTAAEPVVFTSIHDDASGGDSQGDGPTSGTPGDWDRLYLPGSSSGNDLDHVIVRYSGGQGAALQCNGSSTTLNDCAVQFSADDGLSVTKIDTFVDGCLFEGNLGAPIASVPITFLPNFTNNDAQGNGEGDIVLLGGGSLSTALTLEPANAFSGNGTFGLSSNVEVGTSGHLTLLPGVIFKGDPAAKPKLTVKGTLTCDAAGDQPIVFTSLRDDTHGGDGNGDGGATQPAPGDWSGLYFAYQSDATVLRNVVVRYAGSASAEAVTVDKADLLLEGCTFELSESDALEVSSAAPSIQGCAFDDNGGRAIVGAHLRDVAGFANNTASGNGGGDVLWVTGNGIQSDVTIGAAAGLNGMGVFAVEGGVGISGTGALTLSPGVILKFQAGAGVNVGEALVCNGTAGQPVVFTSIHDDERGGDSAGDGPTTGSPGDWVGLDFYLQNGSVLDHIEVRFAGGGGVPAIFADFGSPGMSNSTVEHCAGPGYDLGGRDAAVTNCTFRSCTWPIVGAPLSSIGLLTGNVAEGSTVADVVRVGGVGSQPSTFSVTMANSMNGNGVFVQSSDLLALSQGTLEFGPGVVWKVEGPRQLEISAVTQVLGDTHDRVVFTSVHDPDHGPEYVDASGAPAPGDWVGFEFNSSASGSLLQDVLVRYGGALGEAAIVLENADVTLCRVTVEYSAGDGLDTSGNSAPTIKDSAFDHNGGKAIEGLTWPVLGNMSGTTATGNGVDDGATVIDSSFVEGHLTIEQGSYFGECIVVNVSPNATYDNTLSFGRGVVVKAGLPSVFMPVARVEGTGLEPVVFTSIHDDQHGGDTNGDGGEVLPLPGDWLGVYIGVYAPEVEDPGMRHALIRYAGGGTIQYIQTASAIGALLTASARVESTRVEYSADVGANLDLAAPAFGANADNVVVYENAGIGLICRDATNCTAVGNGSFGIDAHLATYCISWDNGPSGLDNYTYSADQVLGPFGTNVVWSCGTALDVGPGGGFQGNCGATGWGNIDQDPRFVDAANGDLRLAADSPCRNYFLTPCPSSILDDTAICKPWGISAVGYPPAPPTPRDFHEFPRSLDDDLSGPAPRRADLGAHERAPHALSVALGAPKIGTTPLLLVEGSSGIAVYIAGAEGEVWLPDFGWVLLDPLLPTQLLGLAPVNAALPLPIPAAPDLVGKEFSIEALVIPAAPDTVINPTNVWRPKIQS